VSPVNHAHIRRHHAELLGFEPPDDLTNEPALDAVRLDDDEGSLHDEPI
jgi:hypothetical protein